MIETIQLIAKNILTVIYEQTGFALVIAILFMFAFMHAEEHGIKQTVKKWLEGFRRETKFRRVFVLAFYLAMLTIHTLLNREMYVNPLEKIMSGWGIYDENGQFTTQAVENVILFIPMTSLLFWSFGKDILKRGFCFDGIISKGILISAGASLIIEFLQLFLRVGTLQFADFCYNTLGGLIGSLIYWCGYKLIHRNKKEQ